jgi:hypothetical protein
MRGHHDATPTEKLALSPPLSPASLQPNQDPQNEAPFYHELIFCVVLYRIPNSTLNRFTLEFLVEKIE